MTNPYAEAAEELHARGWAPFPLPPHQKGPPPKERTGEHGKDATAELTHTLAQTVEGNVGTRAPRNVIGIDVDQYDDKQGGNNLVAFMQEHGLERLPRTYVTTARGLPSGIHWFQIPDGTAKLAGAPVSGVELIQRHHRYAVMPPSLHPDGGTYQWIHNGTGEVCEAPPHTDELPHLPHEWVDALIARTIDLEPREPIDWKPQEHAELHPIVARALERVDHAQTGGRHDAMCAAQMALTRFESLGYPGATTALTTLRERFLEAVGEGRADEWDRAADGARHKVAHTVTSTPPYTADPIDHEAPDVDLTGLDQPGPQEPGNKILHGLLRGDAILNMPPPDPMVGNWLDRGMVFSVVGQYGSAKTFALLDMAMAVTTGRPWLGEQIHHTGPALYVVAEGGYTIGPRIRGWLEHTGHPDVPEDFALYPDRINLLDPVQRVELIDACIDLAPALVIIDTMAQSMPGGDENSSVDMSLIYETADRIRKDTGASVGFARHTGHSAQKRGRGFSGYEDNSDVVLAVSGKVKDGPVQLTSEKQKARENPPPMFLALQVSGTGNPHLTVTASGPDNGTQDERLTKTKTTILSAVRRYRGDTGLTKEEWIERAPGAAKDVRRAAFVELVDLGWFLEEEAPVNFGNRTRPVTKYVPNPERFDT